MATKCGEITVRAALIWESDPYAGPLPGVLRSGNK